MNYSKLLDIIKCFVILTLIFVFISNIIPLASGFYTNVLAQANIFISILILVTIIIGVAFIWAKIDQIFRVLGSLTFGIVDSVTTKIKSRPEKLFLSVLPIISQIFLIFLSKDFTGLNTKLFLSVIVWVLTIFLILFLSERGNKVLLFIIMSILILSVISAILIKSNITGINSLFTFISQQLQNLKSYPLIDILLILIITLSILTILFLSVYYGIKPYSKSKQ